MSYLDCAPRTEGGGRRRIEVIDQTLRDGPQSWWGMRLRKDMGLPIAAELDRTGFHTIDLVGSSIFEVLVRHCHEDPWDQLISLSRAMPQTTVRAGTRSNGIVTFGLTADSVMDLWVQRLCAHGIGSFWIYDGLFNTDKIGRLVKTVQAQGAQGHPVHPVRGQSLPHRRVLRGAHPGAGRAGRGRHRTGGRGGSAHPRAHPHTGHRDQAGGRRVAGGDPLPQQQRAGAAELPGRAAGRGRPGAHGEPAAGRRGVAALDRGHRGQPALRRVRRRPGRVPVRARSSSTCCGWPSTRRCRSAQPAEYTLFQYRHQLPGGMAGTFKAQLRDRGMEDRFEEVLDEMARVREELGYPVMATPFSQLVGTQAVLNVVTGKRYSVVPDEVLIYAHGFYGQPVTPLDQNVLDTIMSSPKAGQFGDWEPPQPSLTELRHRFGENDLRRRAAAAAAGARAGHRGHAGHPASATATSPRPHRRCDSSASWSRARSGPTCTSRPKTSR